MSEPIGKSTRGKIGLSLSLVPFLALGIASLMRPSLSRPLMENLVGPLFSLMSPVALGLSCVGLRRDPLKRFAIAGVLISAATLGWFALSEAIRIINRG